MGSDDATRDAGEKLARRGGAEESARQTYLDLKCRRLIATLKEAENRAHSDQARAANLALALSLVADHVAPHNRGPLQPEDVVEHARRMAGQCVDARLRVGLTTADAIWDADRAALEAQTCLDDSIRDADALSRLSQELRTRKLRGDTNTLGAVDAALAAIDELTKERDRAKRECILYRADSRADVARIRDLEKKAAELANARDALALAESERDDLREKLGAAECLLGEVESGAIQVNDDLKRGREIEEESRKRLDTLEEIATAVTELREAWNDMKACPDSGRGGCPDSVLQGCRPVCERLCTLEGLVDPYREEPAEGKS